MYPSEYLVTVPSPVNILDVVLSQPVDMGSVRALLANTQTLDQILQEAHSLLSMFWRAALPSSDSTKQVKDHCVYPQHTVQCYLKGH